MSNKNEIISKVYYDLSGYGSMNETTKDAKEIDKTITFKDVKEWFANNVKSKNVPKGTNSFVANGAYQEYQLDLLFIKHLPDQNYDTAMLCIDAFTKYCAIVPIKSKNESELALGFIECMNKMGKPPKVIYTDGETGIRNSGLFQKYFDENHITYVATKSHPIFAERMILTFKTMLDKRIKPGQQWTDLIFPILLTYNNKLVHSATGLTPKDARLPSNELTAYVNMSLQAKHQKKYPEIKVGDKVYIYTKRTKMQKSHVSVWSDIAYEVIDISHSHGITFYKTTAREKGFLRHELKKV